MFTYNLLCHIPVYWALKIRSLTYLLTDSRAALGSAMKTGNR